VKKIACILGFVSLILTSCCTPRTWEYREAASIDEANQMAKEGWTIVGFNRLSMNGQPEAYYLMKKPIK
jgi:hypothetical protein